MQRVQEAAPNHNPINIPGCKDRFLKITPILSPIFTFYSKCHVTLPDAYWNRGYTPLTHPVSILSVNSVSLLCLSILSVYSVSLFCPFILSLYSVRLFVCLFCPFILSVYSASPLCQSILPVYSVRLLSVYSVHLLCYLLYLSILCLFCPFILSVYFVYLFCLCILSMYFVCLSLFFVFSLSISPLSAHKSSCLIV